ncbi:MAG: hypothetical protein ACW98F_08155 [Candidatus Hodarchaeales archaeon]
MYNDKIKLKVQQIIENDTRIGQYDGSLFYIFDGWSTIREINEIMGYSDEYDHRSGSDKLDLDQILTWVNSDILFPIDLDDIEYFYNQLEIKSLIDNGQLSFIDIKPDLERFNSIKDIILQYKEDFDLDYLNDDIKDLIGESEWGFSDEYNICQECDNVLRTSPDSYHWTPDYYQDPEGCQFCKECCDNGDLIEYSIQHTQENIDNGIEPNSLAWIFDLEDTWHIIDSDPDSSYSSRWVNGLHGGQKDSPLKQGQIVRELKDNDGQSIFEIVFRVYPSQFDTEWDCYIRINPNLPALTHLYLDLEKYIEYFRDKFNSPEGQYKHDPAKLMEKALKQDKPAYSTISTNYETGEIDIAGTNNLDEFLNSKQ